MKNEYKAWLEKQLDKAIKEESKNDDNYQETGNPRYARARDKAACTRRAFIAALQTENGKDEVLELTRRVMSGLKTSAENYRATLPAENALQRIIDDLSSAALFGGR